MYYKFPVDGQALHLPRKNAGFQRVFEELERSSAGMCVQFATENPSRVSTFTIHFTSFSRQGD